MTAKDYTVILMRPDYVADNFGQDSYVAWVTAMNPDAAIRAAQQEAYTIDMGSDPDSPGYPADYFVVTIFDGHLSDSRHD
jgi:hypothetical protein